MYFRQEYNYFRTFTKKKHFLVDWSIPFPNWNLMFRNEQYFFFLLRLEFPFDENQIKITNNSSALQLDIQSESCFQIAILLWNVDMYVYMIYIKN